MFMKVPVLLRRRLGESGSAGEIQIHDDLNSDESDEWLVTKDELWVMIYIIMQKTNH